MGEQPGDMMSLDDSLKAIYSIYGRALDGHHAMIPVMNFVILPARSGFTKSIVRSFRSLFKKKSYDTFLDQLQQIRGGFRSLTKQTDRLKRASVLAEVPTILLVLMIRQSVTLVDA